MTDKSYTKTISFKYRLLNAVTIMNNECCHNQKTQENSLYSLLSPYTFNCYYLKKEKPSLKMFEGVVVFSFLFVLRLPF